MVDMVQEIWDIVVIATLRGGLYALFAVGLSLVFGVMNIANFSHGEFYMIGAYFAFFGVTMFHLGPLLSILMAGLLAFLIGVVVERGLFNPLRKKKQERLADEHVPAYAGDLYHHAKRGQDDLGL